MRRDVEFNSSGDTVRGWLCTPDHRDGPFPAIVMAGGWCYVKEIVMPHFAEMFADAGFAALLFDYRNFGASDGARRLHIDPWAQIEDYNKNAITYLESLDEVDADRIGVCRWRRASTADSAGARPCQRAAALVRPPTTVSPACPESAPAK